MRTRRRLPVALGLLAILALAGAAVPAVASPSPIPACPPCEAGFVHASAAHDLDTEVRHSEATVRVHRNGSATWTVRVVPRNESVLDRLAGNGSLARAVAADSFGVRYGSGIEHELLSAGVAGDAFVIRYRTLDVVRESAFGTRTLTYFRDSPGAYVYTDLGADELTVVAPPGMTVARGFGDVDGRRMTATALPDVRDGPFVVFAPGGSLPPELFGALALLDVLGGVVVRNVLLFVALPGGVLVGGVAGIRRLVDPTAERSPTRLGGGVAAGGALLLAGTLLSEGHALPAVTGNLLSGGVGGAVLLALGASVAVPGVRRRLSPGRLVAVGLLVGAIAVAVADGVLGARGLHAYLASGVALFPVVVALGWVDARGTPHRTADRWLFAGAGTAVFGALAAFAPLTALGGALFLVGAVLVTLIAVGSVVVAGPLYLLGAAAATSEPG